MSETIQSSVDYENSSEFGFDLSENDWQNLADGARFDETQIALAITERREQRETGSCFLSKKDFKDYFEGEDFQQRNIGDCRLLAVIDSLVSFGDYEQLIRTSVIKDNTGYTFYLPLGAPHLDSYKFFVSYEELNTNQVGIDGNRPILVTGKQGIQALVLAYGKKCTGKYGQFDYSNLGGGCGDCALNDLVFGIKTYCETRTTYSETDDPLGNKDSEFIDKFYKTLEGFNRKYDMLTLSVNQLQESDLDRQNIEGEAYSSLGHYSKPNHEISVEKVRKQNGKLIVTVSNPRNSNRTYDIAFNDLIKSCRSFFLGTKRERQRLTESNRTNTNQMAYHATDRAETIEDIRNVNQVVQLTGEADEALREARGDILVTENGNNTFKVSSYGLEMGIKEKEGKIIIYNNGIELSINKTKLSNKYKYDGKTVENDKYPLLLYGAKIANFINMMRKLYINPKKRDKSNNKPFRILDGSLQFDDDPIAMGGLDSIRREGAELFGDDYIECLNDWGSIGISSSDKNTKRKIANLLNKFVERRKPTY